MEKNVLTFYSQNKHGLFSFVINESSFYRN